jgi:hypothetical protein
MKSLIISLLGSALLLNGCTSFKPLEAEDRAEGRPKPDERIRLTLVDGSEIEAESYVEVLEPSDFVYGVGKIFAHGIIGGEAFTGKIIRARIDSITTSVSTVAKSTTRAQSRRKVVYWLTDRSHVELEDGKHVSVTPDSGTGRWYIGTMESNGQTSDFAGRIPYEEIKEIEVRQFSTLKTIGLVYLISGVIYGATWGGSGGF